MGFEEFVTKKTEAEGIKREKEKSQEEILQRFEEIRELGNESRYQPLFEQRTSLSTDEDHIESNTGTQPFEYGDTSVSIRYNFSSSIMHQPDYYSLQVSAGDKWHTYATIGRKHPRSISMKCEEYRDGDEEHNRQIDKEILEILDYIHGEVASQELIPSNFELGEN